MRSHMLPVVGLLMLFGSRAQATTRTVPSPYSQIYEALAESSSGDVVLVSDSTTAYDPFVMVKGVTVAAAEGNMPEITCGSDTAAVVWPADADENTWLDGFLIIGTNSANVIVAIKNNGKITNCTLDAAGSSVPVGLYHTGNGTNPPWNENLTVRMNYTSNSRTGILLDKSTFLLRPFHVEIRGDVGTVWGVHCINGIGDASGGQNGPTISRGFVTAPNGIGIEFTVASETGVWKSAIVSCTVDSVASYGIKAGTGVGVIDCISTNADPTTGINISGKVKQVRDCVAYQVVPPDFWTAG